MATSANRALIFAALGALLFPLFGLVGWFYGRRALLVIRRSGAGIEHSGAARFGVIVGIYEAVAMLFIIVTGLKDLGSLG